ncbi:MAG: metal ABC transporter permease, partial [Vicinamibacteria bacterium]
GGAPGHGRLRERSHRCGGGGRMIEDFLLSWDLFRNVYLAGWLIAVLLSLAGVLVVARDQIFIGAAVSQASTLGIALALGVTGFAPLAARTSVSPEILVSAMAVVFAIAASVATSRGGANGRESHEAVAGWVFLASASFSILVVVGSPHGLEEVHRLLASSVIGATAEDVWMFAALALLGALFLAAANRRVVLFAVDPVMASAVGMRVGRWRFFLSVGIGLALGLSIRASGTLYSFGCLVLPALVAKNVCREIRPMFLVAPLVALAAGVLGFAFADRYDYPPAQLTVALLSLFLAIAWIIRRFRA